MSHISSPSEDDESRAGTSACVLAPDSRAQPPAGGSVLLRRASAGATTCSSTQLLVTLSAAGWDSRRAIQLVILNELRQPRDISLCRGDEGEVGSTQRLSSGSSGVFEDKRAEEQTGESPSWRSKASLQTALLSEPEKVRPSLGLFTSWGKSPCEIRSRSHAVKNSWWLPAELNAALS